MTKKLNEWTEKILKEHSFGIALVFFGLIFLVCTITTGWLIYINIESIDQFKEVSKTGPLGDTFNGLLGPFIAFLIAILTFLAFYIQYQANQIQLEALENQAESSRLSQFESTFFNLLKVQQDIRNNSEYTNSYIEEFDKRPQKSFQSFEGIYNELRSKLESIEDTIKEVLNEVLTDKDKILNINDGIQPAKITLLKQIDSEIKIARIAYYIIFSKHNNKLSHYFRNLYHILKFVREKEIEEISSNRTLRNNEDFKKQIKAKYKKYVDLIQAQMSPPELILMFYNGICFPKAKGLIHIYDFLENLSKDDLIKDSHTLFYKNYIWEEEKFPDVNFKNKQDILQLNMDGKIKE